MSDTTKASNHAIKPHILWFNVLCWSIMDIVVFLAGWDSLDWAMRRIIDTVAFAIAVHGVSLILEE